MNVDIGGGTSKIAVCADGKVIDLTAVDVGARSCEPKRPAISRIEEAGRRFAAELDEARPGRETDADGRSCACRTHDAGCSRR